MINRIKICAATSSPCRKFELSQRLSHRVFSLCSIVCKRIRGVLFAYTLGSHTKQVYEEGGNKNKIKEHDDFNINPFRTDLTLRVGYREVTVFANYALTHLFKSKEGPELPPWTMGVSLAGW